jgi:predicted MFS family arabinose efflux permease
MSPEIGCRRWLRCGNDRKTKELPLDASTHVAIDESSLRYDGWRIVAVCFLVATFGWAFGFYGQSVYLAELHRARGWPASLVSGATTFFYLFGAGIVVFVAEAVRKCGPRNCLIAGTFAMALAAIGIGQVNTPWQLYLADAVLAFGWAGMSLAMVNNTLGLWFDHKRGMAISLALNGASFAGIVGVPLLVVAIGYFGFAKAMIVAACVMVALVVPTVLVFVGRPPLHMSGATAAAAADAPSSMQIRSFALRDISFLSVTTAFALVLFAQVGFIVHLISFLDPLIGRASAATALALLAAMAVVGRVLFSTVIDRLNQRLASALSFISQAIALAVIINFRSEWLVIAACALFGFSVGNVITLPSLIVQREFDARSFGVLVALQTAIAQVTYAFGPGVIGVLRDLSGSYTVPFYACIALELTAAVLIMIRGSKSSLRGA